MGKAEKMLFATQGQVCTLHIDAFSGYRAGFPSPIPGLASRDKLRGTSALSAYFAIPA